MVRQWLMHDDGFTIAQNQKTTLLWFSSNAESMPAQRVPVKIDCLDLSNSMKSACPDCTSMKVQIGFVTSRRWLNFQVVAWAGVLTSRNSLKLCGKAKCCLQAYPIVLYAGHSMSFIPGFFTTKSWLVVACCCSSQFSLSQWKYVKVIQQRGWKLQAASPCPHPGRSSGMEPILYAVAAHPWSPTCSLLDFEQTSTQWVNSVHPTVTCHTQPTHASFFVKNINNMSTKTVQIELKPR